MTECEAPRKVAKWRGGVEPCGREATWHAHFLGHWLTLCGRHVAAYYDLPRHRIGDRMVCEGGHTR